jgi:hypothetical protein
MRGTFMNDETALSLIAAIRSISHGGTSGPTGLEMLSMAISGERNAAPLGSAIQSAGSEVAEGLNAIAAAIDNLAEAVQRSNA